jgi:hypothetical protein
VTLARAKQVFAKRYHDSDLAQAIARTRKVAIVSTYHELNIFLEYQKTMFKSLNAAGYTCIIVHNCNSFDARLSVDADAGFLIVRRNMGYDFGSYATGLSTVLSQTQLVDEILFVNDSIIQTASSLDGLMSRIRALDCDMVGITDSFDRAYHIQSYFFWVGKKIIRSPFLTNFFATYSVESQRAQAIEDGELALTSCALSEGFQVKAICGYEALASVWLSRQDENRAHLDRLTSKLPTNGQRRVVMEQFENTVDFIRRGIAVNPSHFFWDTLLIDFSIPFIKREFVLRNPAEIASYIRLSEVLDAFPNVQSAIREMRRRYGGERVPPLHLGPESSRAVAVAPLTIIELRENLAHRVVELRA